MLTIKNIVLIELGKFSLLVILTLCYNCHKNNIKDAPNLTVLQIAINKTFKLLVYFHGSLKSINKINITFTMPHFCPSNGT